jgi:hypothetical protein
MDEHIMKEVRRLRRAVRLLGVGLIGACSVLLVGATVTGFEQAPGDLRVRSLTVVDERGVARVILAAPVPEPIVQGQRGRRRTPASGILLNGPDGNERGGYVTADIGGEAALSLDGQDGREVFRAVGNANAGGSLFLIHGSGAVAALTTYRGEPELHMIGSNGQRMHTVPANAPPIE